jgi:tripartite-type tricarboxylate transporter receptor subunit TctC
MRDRARSPRSGGGVPGPIGRVARRALVLLACGFALVQTAGAQTAGTMAAGTPWPQRALRLIVPYPPGGVTDLIARQIAPAMAERLGQPIVIDNRAGAAGMTGTVAAAHASADGHTLLAVFDTFANNPLLFRQAGYDPIRDFAPIALLVRAPQVLVVPPRAGGPRTLAEFIEQGRTRPGGWNYASASAGSSSHLTAELLRLSAGIDLMPVHYKGGGPALNDLLGGQVDAMFTPVGLAGPQVRNGRLLALAVTSPRRSSQMPEVPALAERYPGFEAQAWVALFAPAQTPRAPLDAINAAVNAALVLPEVREKLAAQGYDAAGGSPEALGEWLRAEVNRWGAVIRARNITLD